MRRSDAPAGGGMLAVGVALLLAVVMVLGLLTVIIDDDNNACAAVAAPGLNSAGGTAPRAVGDPKAPLQVRVASWNTLFANSTANVVAGVRDVGRTADVIGVQELFPASRRHRVAAALQAEFAMTSANNAVEILWRRDRFELVAQGDVRVFGVEHIEGGTSGTSIGPKGITWVQLRAKDTGATFFAVNNHLVPDIERGGHPNPRAPVRVRLAVRQQNALVAVVDRLRAFGPVFATGDFNVDARRDARTHSASFPYAILGRHALVSNWRVLGYPRSGTHGGGRLIDYVWSTAASAIPVAQRIGASHGSDHHPVTVTVTKRRTAAATAGAASPAASSPSAGDSNAALLPGSSQAKLPATLTVPGRDGRGSITLRGEQVGYAALAVAEAKAHNLPVYAAVVFLATAEVESGLRNLPYGDRDSVGLAQQRPSSGWGTRSQILTPKLAIDAFYGVARHTHNPGLVDIANWRTRPLGEVSQAVQGSAFPARYQHYETTARAIVSALAGAVGTVNPAYSPDPACGGADRGVVGTCPPTGRPAEHGLTPDALLVLRCGGQKFPKITTFYGIGQREGASDHPTGRAVDLMVPDYKTATGSAYGWQVAHWVRANAAALGVHYVIYAARIWNLDRNPEGWRVYHSVTGSDNDTSLHYDHVHVSVFGSTGTGPPAAVAAVPTAAGTWVLPLPAGRYRVGCGMGCYPGHTGQDFPVHSGTPVYATNDGTVIRSVALRNSSGSYRSYGNLVVIRAAHAPGTEVYYAHLQQRLVQPGAAVRAGQQIGLSGYTGHVIPQGEGGAHLHYEIRQHGTPVNPIPVLAQHGVKP